MDWFNVFVYFVLIPLVVFGFYYGIFSVMRFILWQY